MGKSTFFQDFKAFAMKGNVVDMAVGIIIGAAFGKIVSSVVSDIIMPLVGLLVGGFNVADLKIMLEPAEVVDGVEKAAVYLNYGMFIQSVIDFLIIAFSIFMLIKFIAKLDRKKKEAPAPAPEPAPTKEEVLLGEIRDLLKEQAQQDK
jgi:large conductance mechanosensitive channel protein